MRRLTRSRRWAVLGVVSVGVAMGAGDAVLLTVGHAQQQDALSAGYGIFNGQVSAAADREQVFTTNDAGFSDGAVNNYYPLATVDVATAGTSAAASPADTGPLAQTVFAGQNVQQPQYVRAHYPGTQNPSPYSAGSGTASAAVTPASGTASATYGTVGASATSTDQSDGSDGGTANVSSYFDSAQGFVTIGDSRVHRASYGGGVLVINNVHVSVQVSTNGSGKFVRTVSVTVGGATVGTVPVTIDQNGVTIQQSNVPLIGAIQPTQAAVNDALARAGLSVHTVAPLETQSGDNLHVEAVGVVVDFLQPAVEGTPTQRVRHTLGVVVLDNEATVAQALDTTPFTDAGATAALPVTSTTGGDAGASAATGASGAGSQSPARSGAVPVAALVTPPRPRWLLLAYLAWQALMLALVGALYLRRSATRQHA
jgi:hypothetical protein